MRNIFRYITNTFQRLTINFVIAGKLWGEPGESKHLLDANGVRPRFGRCWWYWFPGYNIAKRPAFIPQFDIFWLCFMISIMFWGQPIKNRLQPKVSNDH